MNRPIKFPVPLLALLALGNSAHAAEPAPLVAPLDDQQLIQGCSWLASAPALGRGYVFMADYDDSAIWMNIDGSDVSLEAVDTRGSLRGLGDVMERRYRADGVEVDARYEASWVCPATGAESCELTRFDARFEVRKGERMQVVEGTGEVGC